MFLKVGTATERVHLNWVRPCWRLTTEIKRCQETGLPPYFQEGGCPPSSGAGDPNDSISSNDDASATVSTPVEIASPMVQNPYILQQEAGDSSNDNATVHTSHSAWVVKPVQRFWLNLN